MTVQGLIITLESTLNIPENHRLIAVFENNESDKIIGFLCVENGREGDYEMMTAEELIKKYGKENYSLGSER
jgi:hypothetical protein